MSQPPTPYSRQYNFAGWSVANPTTPHQGNKLDQEYNAILATVNQTISRLGEIQRDDGALRLDEATAADLAAESEGVLAAAAEAAVEAAAAGTHTHTIAQVSTLQAALDAKASSTALTNGLAGKANTSHTHAIADVTGLTAALAAKADDTEITDINTALAGKAATSHTHAQADVTGLTAALADKVDVASQLAPRAWVSFDGTTTPPTIKSSYNVTSVARSNVGIYLITFTNALPDANYCWIASARGTAASSYMAYQSTAGAAQTTTTMNIVTANSTAAVNCSLVNVMVYR